MNILQVIPYFAFKRGGDVNVCYNLSKQLTSMGHNVTTLTTTFEYNKEDTDLVDNLTMVPIDYEFNLALFIYSPKMKKWLDKNITKYDIIHLHELRSYQNNIVIKYAKKYNIPYVLQPHNSTPKHVTKTLIKHIYDIFYGNNIIQNATTTIAVSKEEAQYDKQMKAHDVRVIYNGMNTKDYENLPEDGTYKDKHIHSPYILYFGRLDKLKGIENIIKAFSLLPERYDEYKLVIAGKSTPYKERLEKIIETRNIEEKVIFTGFIKEEDKISIYHDADVFVNPVEYMGGVAITVFESILAGTPVVVTKESGELIDIMNAGITVEYGNINQLKYAIIETIENKPLAKKHVLNGQAYIHKNLKWTSVANKILKVYEDALNKE